MKKILVTGLLAMAVIAASHQRASAWVNARLGLGVNLGWQSGDHHWFCGAWQSGPLPGGSGHHHDHHQGNHAPLVYLPYVLAGHDQGHHSHHRYPTPGSFDTFSMSPMQYANAPFAASPYYYYQPETFFFGQ